MKLLIFGASGATGHELVKQALSRGHFVTAFVREPARLKLNHENLKIIKGNITDPLELSLVIKDMDVVLSALGASNPFKFDADVVQGLREIITVMQQLTVSRLIYLSFIGVEAARRHGGFVIRYIAPKILRSEIAGHEEREKIIRESTLNWTIVQAPTLTNGKKKRSYRTGEDLSSNSVIVTMSRADVADCMLSQCVDLTFSHISVRVMY